MPAALQLASPPSIWDDRRGALLAALEEACGRAISVNDTHIDTLIATAQAIGMQPHELKTWIYDSSARPTWSPESLVQWARRWSFARIEEDGNEG
jgi:hypothetical protein